MFVAQTGGQIASRFLEEGINSNGQLTRSARRPNALTDARIKAASTIVAAAKETGRPLGVIVSKVLSQSIPELQAYVQARGEVPSDSPKALALQAALLRALEVGTMANSIDTDDKDALQLIEESEQQAIEDNTADAGHIMRPDTAAAITMMLYRMAERYKKRGGTGRMSDLANDLRRSAGANTFDTVSCGMCAANNADGGFIFYTPEQEQETTGSVTDTSTGSGSFWENLFDGIDKTVDAITKVTGAVQTTTANVKNTAGSIFGTVTDIGSDIGSQSIDKYISENWLKIVGVIIGIIIITILIARVGSK